VKAVLVGQVASYKQLASVRFVEAIPKTASGKILRRQLRAAL
jgi:acyl-coenzyme A synthetase/AMP-(fatty) acid ligase